MDVNQEAQTTFHRLFRETADKEANQSVVNLAFAQLQLEDLCEREPRMAAVIRRPQGAADARALRGLLAAGHSLGITPQEDSVGEYAKLLAEGASIKWPPTRRSGRRGYRLRK